MNFKVHRVNDTQIGTSINVFHSLIYVTLRTQVLKSVKKEYITLTPFSCSYFSISISFTLCSIPLFLLIVAHFFTSSKRAETSSINIYIYSLQNTKSRHLNAYYSSALCAPRARFLPIFCICRLYDLRTHTILYRWQQIIHKNNIQIIWQEKISFSFDIESYSIYLFFPIHYFC